MAQQFNIYCDESCHLKNDHKKVMLLGAIWCPLDRLEKANVRLQEIKREYKFPNTFEIKWTKVSPAKVDFYKEIIDYFFDNNELHFRALIVPDKEKLDHNYFNQDHDTWYYKMYFDLLKVILMPENKYYIYIDLKDTRGGDKIKKLHSVLQNEMYDFSWDIIERVQLVHSHEILLMQLADLLLGAVSAENRNETISNAKKKLISLILDLCLRERMSEFFLIKSMEKRNAFGILQQKLMMGNVCLIFAEQSVYLGFEALLKTVFHQM